MTSPGCPCSSVSSGSPVSPGSPVKKSISKPVTSRSKKSPKSSRPRDLIRMEVSICPIDKFKLPQELEEYVPELISEIDDMHAKMATIKAPIATESACEETIKTFRSFSDQQSDILKRARAFNQTNGLIDRPKRKRIAVDINATEACVLSTRAQFSKRMKLMADCLLVQQPEKMIIDAFMDGLLVNSNDLPFPSGSLYGRQDLYDSMKRDERIQSRLRNILLKIYGNRNTCDADGDNQIWCPVLGSFEFDTGMAAAHIVPLSIGTREFAYLHGLQATQDTVYQQLFSADNALMVHRGIEQGLDGGQLVIVPTPEDTDGTQYECRVLLEECRKVAWSTRNGTVIMSDLDGKKLTWMNDRRPSATNLYLRYLLTRWSRKRYEASGWERDADKIPRKKTWYGVKPLRSGVLRKLAYELGDCISPPASRSTSGALSILEEHEIKTIPETIEDRKVDTGMAIRMADNLINDGAEW